MLELYIKVENAVNDMFEHVGTWTTDVSSCFDAITGYFEMLQRYLKPFAADNVPVRRLYKRAARIGGTRRKRCI